MLASSSLKSKPLTLGMVQGAILVTIEEGILEVKEGIVGATDLGWETNERN